MATKSMDLGKVMGTSAYQAAQAGGYTGTQTEFNSALKEVPVHIDNNDIHVTAAQKTTWNGSVRYDAAQNLTDEQKAQARTNIGADTVQGAVLYTPQTLTDEQKAQARTNIGADTVQGAVLYTPQTLTDEQKAQARGNINAAPGGFGLGELTGRTANSFADITGYGFYRVPSESGFAPDTSSNWGAVYIGANLSYGTLLYARNNALMAVRAVSSGEIGPIEWVNPPMNLGTEYRTTERYLGKPLYVKAVNIGSLPNNSSMSVNITTNEDGTANEAPRAISAYGITSNGVCIPAPAYARDPSKQIELQPYVWLLFLTTNFDASDLTGTIVVKYYKTTD